MAIAKQRAEEASYLLKTDDYEKALKIALQSYESLQASYEIDESQDEIPSVVYQALNIANERMTNSAGYNVYLSTRRAGQLLRINEATGRLAFEITNHSNLHSRVKKL